MHPRIVVCLALSLSLCLQAFYLIGQHTSSRDEANMEALVSVPEQLVSNLLKQEAQGMGNAALPHPHAGARHENGQLGLVVDASPRRLAPVTKNSSTSSCPGPPSVIEGTGGRQVLEKVRGGLIKSLAFLENKTAHGESRPRLLCMVYTYEGAHDNLRGVAETWGRRCDGFWAASNVTDHSIGAIDLLHQGPEKYQNMWQKLRSMWAYAYDHFLNQFDYFHVCGDDTYIVVDNVLAYLDSDEVKRLENGHVDTFTRHFVERGHKKAVERVSERPRPLLLGLPMHRGHRDGTYPSGGTGYMLNRRALELFAKEGLPNFLHNLTDPREDVFLGGFFANQGVWTADTRDETGAWRHANQDAEARFKYIEGRPDPVQPRLLQRFNGYRFPGGIDGISEQFISFHLKDSSRRYSIADTMRRYHQILYRDGACNDDNLLSTTADASERPSGLRLAFVGDSIDRYQYLSLVYYLRWGRWFQDIPESERPFKSFLYHEKDGGTWNSYLEESSKLLSPYEVCDCFRDGSKGDYKHETTCENRFFYDPVHDNAVAFLWLPGNKPAQGHLEAEKAFRAKEVGNATSHTLSTSKQFEPFLWQHFSWADLISGYIARLEHRPVWLYLNAHYWPHDFPSIGHEVVDAAKNAGIKTIWSTATISRNFKSPGMFQDVDSAMCPMTDYCLNNTWMVGKYKSADLYDFFHFKPPVYKKLNEQLLSLILAGR